MTTDEENNGNGAALMHPATQRAVTSSREDFGATELVMSGELATAALTAQVKAAIESRYKMALTRPRNQADVRQRILSECRRPKFADEAIYAVPRGRIKDERTGEWIDNIVEGPSIRFVEMALRCMGNTYTKVTNTHDDDRKLVVNVSVTDLESNTTYDSDITIAKTMERQKLRDGQTAIGVRTNSSGRRVYVVEAPEGEMLMKQNALVSKALRTQGLRIIDGDVVAEAMELCNKILADKTAQDPNAARKQIADAFGQLRVMPSDLDAYLGCPLDRASPAQIDQLRKVYAAVRDGQITWHDIAEGKAPPAAPAQPQGSPPGVPSSSAAPASPPAQQAPAVTAAPATTPAPKATAPARQSPKAAAPALATPAPEPAKPVDKQTAVEQAGKDGTWEPPGPPEEPTNAKAEVGSFDKAVDAARAREAERAATPPAAQPKADKPKRGNAAAKDALKKQQAEAQPPQGNMFAGPAPADDLPAWAGGKQPEEPSGQAAAPTESTSDPDDPHWT